MFRPARPAQTELIKIGCSAQHATTSDPHITISRSGGENLEGVFWGVLVEFPISLLNGCQSPILHLTYRRDESDPHITISRSGGENLEGVFWGVLVEFPISLLNGCQSPILHLTYRRDEVVSSPFADGSARLHCI